MRRGGRGVCLHPSLAVGSLPQSPRAGGEPRAEAPAANLAGQGSGDSEKVGEGFNGARFSTFPISI